MGTGTYEHNQATYFTNYLMHDMESIICIRMVSSDANLHHKLGMSVLENWIPFIPIRIKGSITSIKQ